MSADGPPSPEYWRGQAEQARAQLKHTRSAKVRGYLTEIAAEYERLAQIAESQAGSDPPKR